MENFAHLPEEEDFTDTFKLVTREFKNHQKVILHCKVITAKTFNRIKYSDRVKEFIFECNIWIKIDRYDTKTEGSPAFFVMLHPRMNNRDEFSKDLLQILSDTHKDDANSLKGTNKDGNKGKLQVTPSILLGKIPDFHLEVSQKNGGNSKRMCSE